MWLLQRWAFPADEIVRAFPVIFSTVSKYVREKQTKKCTTSPWLATRIFILYFLEPCIVINVLLLIIVINFCLFVFHQAHTYWHKAQCCESKINFKILIEYYHLIYTLSTANWHWQECTNSGQGSYCCYC